MPPLFSRLGLCACLLLSAPSWSWAGLEAQRPLFARAEQAIKQGRAAEAEPLLAGLTDYPLYPYLLYQKLARELGNGPAIRAFLARFDQSRPALLLRQRWLERLAEQGAWAEYADNYREADSPKLECAYYLALAKLGRGEEAWAGAQRLWATGASLPASCERLFELWQATPGFGVEQVWQRYGLAMQKGNLDLALVLRALLPEEGRAQADFWRQVHDNPRLVLSCSAWNPAAPAAAQAFAHGIDRLATSEPVLAQTAWVLHKNRFGFDPGEEARIDRRTALALAAQRHELAWAYLLDLPKASADAQTRGWRVRAALARRDWAGALAAIELLVPEEKQQAQWLYWRGRGLEALGDRQGALDSYRLAARERDFFGLNAADRVGADYPLASRPIPAGEEDLARLAARPPFLAVQEWHALGREAEARSEWFHAVKALPPADLPLAAKLAQRWGLDNLAINTAAKAGQWDDLDLRFPLGYQDLLTQAAKARQVDPAWVYAVVRRESAFDAGAGSPVGAVGLMQLMPATGELMAKRLQESWPGPAALLDPGRNLRYGTAYLRGLLDKFGQHLALAAAAYNAGPGRVERWLPTEGAMPADLWVETIPFSETRQYVAAVLFHAVVYQARLSPAAPRIASLLPDVPPGAVAAGPGRVAAVPACE